MMNVVSLFSGVGGFEMGFEHAGCRTAFQCEIDKHASAVLRHHWPDTPKWGDVSTLTGAHVLSHVPQPDVIIFGSPCQDLSVAGRREGLDGARSGLFYQAMRLIKEIRDETAGRFPRWTVWENVAGALTSNRGADFGAVLDTMAEAGAVGLEWALLDAQHFGVPQRRRRVFVVACYDPATWSRCPDPLLPVSEGVRRHPAPSQQARQDATGSAAQRAAGDGQWAAGEGADGQLRQSISAKWSKGTSGPSGDEYMNLVVEPVAITYSVREDATANTFSATELDRSNALSALWPSVQSHHAQMFIAEPSSVRRLTPLECERLMGWSDDHTRWTDTGKEQTDTQRYRQCGNGVATPVAQWIAEQIVAVDRQEVPPTAA